MIEIDFYYTTSEKWFLDFARSLGKASGEILSVENGCLKFPSTLATGTMNFLQLGPGISALLMDCTFHKEIRLNRLKIAANDCFQILFNVGNKPLLIDMDHGERINISSSFAESVMFSTHSMGAVVHPGVHVPMRSVLLIFDRSWGVRNLFKQPAGRQVKRIQQFLDHEPMQFVSHLDAQSLRLAEEMLSIGTGLSTSRQYLKGCALQLCALFFNNIIREEIFEDRIVKTEATQLSLLKDSIESNLQKPLPSLEEAADRCLMSRTKFMTTFKQRYGKSYTNYFSDLRLEKAKQLLQQDFDVPTAAAETGYSSVNYFCKVFKAQFGVSPLEFQQAQSA